MPGWIFFFTNTSTEYELLRRLSTIVDSCRALTRYFVKVLWQRHFCRLFVKVASLTYKKQFLHENNLPFYHESVTSRLSMGPRLPRILTVAVSTTLPTMISPLCIANDHDRCLFLSINASNDWHVTILTWWCIYMCSKWCTDHDLGTKEGQVHTTMNLSAIVNYLLIYIYFSNETSSIND